MWGGGPPFYVTFYALLLEVENSGNGTGDLVEIVEILLHIALSENGQFPGVPENDRFPFEGDTKWRAQLSVCLIHSRRRFSWV